MPAVALVGAYASVTAGLGAIAGATGFAALAAGAQIAGGVLTGLGAITKNKKMMKIGAVLSIGGGLGTAMSKAGTAGSLGLKAAPEVGASASGIGGTASNLAEMGGGQGLTMSVGGAKSAGDFLTGGLGDSVSALGGPAPASGGSLAQAAAPVGADVASATNALSGTGGGLKAPQPLSGGVINQNAGLGVRDSSLGQSTSTFGKVMDFMRDKQNAELLKVGGGLVQGAMSSYDQQQMVKEKLRQEDAARGRYNQSILGQNLFRY
jgi:hypothetical protein